MLEYAYFFAKIGLDTADREQSSANKLATFSARRSGPRLPIWVDAAVMTREKVRPAHRSSSFSLRHLRSEEWITDITVISTEILRSIDAQDEVEMNLRYMRDEVEEHICWQVTLLAAR